MENKDCVILKRSEYNELLRNTKEVHIFNNYLTNPRCNNLNNIIIDVRINNLDLSVKISKQIKEIVKKIESSLIASIKEDADKLLERKTDMYNEIYDEGEYDAYLKLANMSWYERRKELKKWKDR